MHTETKTPIDYEVIISTCGKFSDLWDAYTLLLGQNWAQRGSKTYLVTDDPTDRSFEGVTVVSAGEGTEITQRLAKALESVTAKYILFTLDDYFLTEPINNGKILDTLAFMEAESIDYVRLYPAKKKNLHREHAVPFADHEGYYLRDLSEGTYKISLYPGLWRTDFMRKTLGEVMNAWQYEVALTPMARELGARCVISNHCEFPFLDVIRKGKVLRKAHKYFQKNPIYQSDRPVLSRRVEMKLKFRVWLHYGLPTPILKLLKRIMMKLGVKFFSPVE